MTAAIPVFVSAPTMLSPDQQASYDCILGILEDENLERRALGRSDFGIDAPLKEVYAIARHCSGGLILGYSQARAERLVPKPWLPGSKALDDQPLPTPWNNLEAGLLYGLKIPLMIFREQGIVGGVFDPGVSELYVQTLPLGRPSPEVEAVLKSTIKTWAGKVRQHYRAY